MLQPGISPILCPTITLVIGAIAVTFLFVAGKQNGVKGHFIISRAIGEPEVNLNLGNFKLLISYCWKVCSTMLNFLAA